MLVAGFCCQQQKPGLSLFVTETQQNSGIIVGVSHCLGEMNSSNLNRQMGKEVLYKTYFLSCWWPTASPGWLLCRTTETNTCCSSTSAWPPAGTTHVLHTLRASPVSFVRELYQPRMQTSSLPQKRWGFGMTLPEQRASPWGRILLQHRLGWISTLRDLARGRGRCYLHL